MNNTPRDGKRDEKEKHVDDLLKCAAENRMLMRSRTLAQYLFHRFRRGALYTELQRLLAYLRRVRMIAYLLRFFSLLLTLVETGAVVLITTALFLILLPIGITFLLASLLIALIQSRKTNRLLRTELEGRTVYVFFGTSSSHENDPSRFLARNVLDCSQRIDCACLWISPYWISSKGLFQKGFYCTARKEAAHLYLVRRYYFFSLKRNVLKKTSTVYVF